MSIGSAYIEDVFLLLNKAAQLILIAVCLLAMSPSAMASDSQAFKFKPVVQAGDAAPVPAQLSSVDEFAFNDQGQVALLGDGGIILKSGADVIPIAATGDFAPGGGVFLSVDAPSLGPDGQVVFAANVTFPGTSGLYSFSNGSITLLLADGTLAGDGEAVTPGGATFTKAGDMLVGDAFSGTLFLFSDGTLTRLVGRGDPAPGGGSFTLLIGGVMNQAGQVAFQAFLSNGGNGIFLLSGGTITKIVATGDIFPDGVPFAFADAPAINDSGEVVFGGTSNSIADSGVFSYSNGHLSLLVPEFETLPNGFLFEEPFSTSLNNAGEIVFTGLDTHNNTGVYLFANGQLKLLQTAGEDAPNGGTFRSSIIVGAAINASDQVLFLADRVQHGNGLYLFSGGQLTPVIGQGDLIPRQPTFEFPTALALGGGDRVLISDSTFPGGAGAYTATPVHGQTPSRQILAVHVGETIGVDGVVDFLFGSAMNQSGEVAADLSSSEASGTLLLQSGDAPGVVADSSASSLVDPGASAPAINDLGQIAFNGFAPSSGTSGIFLNTAGQSQLLLSTGTPLPDGTTLQNITNLSLNNQLQLAFMAAPVFPNTAFFLSSGGQLTTLASNGSPAPGGGTFQIFFASPRLGPVINNRGDVAFASSLSGTPGGFFGSGGVFLYSNGALTRIVGPNDPSPNGGVFLFADAPSINSAGDVAFFAETSAFNFGAFVWHQGRIAKIAVAGDIVSGQFLGFVDLPVFGNDGHLAFTASLLDGRNAVYVAEDTTVSGADSGTWVSSVAGVPPTVEEVMWQAKKRHLMQSHRDHRHPGQIVTTVSQTQH
ncbi:MAG TPA: choice-of-anchor tandem repeat NxxGxxAF-containing protein [Candidatus Angelobacter sp.]|nr:choice-of-anchor tandem repeat NxxGxxAF-containing protein [Candidatus Angelobacter sp.]